MLERSNWSNDPLESLEIAVDGKIFLTMDWTK